MTPFELWNSIPGIPEDMQENWDEWTAWLREGTLEAFPDSARQLIQPEDMIRLGEPDRAARRLANPPVQFIGNLYRIWAPIFDQIRDHPLMQVYLEDHDLAGATVRRTPVDEREMPSVLRSARTEAAP